MSKTYSKDEFFAALYDIVDRKIHTGQEKFWEGLTKTAIETVKKEEAYYFKTVSALMNRGKKPSVDPTNNNERMEAFQRVRWKELRPSTQRRKERLGGASFRNKKWYSGETTAYGRIHLKDYLKQLDVRNFFPEPVDVRVKTSRETSKRDYYRVYINSGLQHNMKKLEGRENNMFNNKDIDAKINSPTYNGESNEQRRPIFRPVAEYYVRQRLPRKVNEVLRKEGYKVEFV
jgi:hypothetical protein